MNAMVKGLLLRLIICTEVIDVTLGTKLTLLLTIAVTIVFIASIIVKHLNEASLATSACRYVRT
jgi:hypothetical protein